MNELVENTQEFVEQSNVVIPSNSPSQTEDLQKIIEQRFAAALLKLEHLDHVPSTAVDVF